jgi:hypothetical protein
MIGKMRIKIDFLDHFKFQQIYFFKIFISSRLFGFLKLESNDQVIKKIFILKVSLDSRHKHKYLLID